MSAGKIARIIQTGRLATAAFALAYATGCDSREVLVLVPIVLLALCSLGDVGGGNGVPILGEGSPLPTLVSAAGANPQFTHPDLGAGFSRQVGAPSGSPEWLLQ